MIRDLLLGYSYKKIIDSQITKYSENDRVYYVNLILNKLFELNNYIKYEMIKIIDYLELFHVDFNSNPYLKQFINLLENFSNANSNINKIFDDLGIQRDDFNEIKKILNLNEEFFSTSKIITMMKENINKIMESKTLNPFTKKEYMKFIN